MLARLADELPRGDWLYEPKWDGFRCLVLRDGDGVELRSRHGNRLDRYFPELVEALAAARPAQFVADGEVVADAGFPALMSRIHPAASRVERLRAEVPARLVVFDLLAADGEEIADRPFAQRRAALERLELAAPLEVTEATRDRNAALRWLDVHEGVIAKRLDEPYAPGRRAMVKVKPTRTVDCVVAGMRPVAGEAAVASLLLGLWDGDELVHVGVASSFSRPIRAALFEELAPLAAPLEAHPWREGYSLRGGPTGRLRGSAGRWTPSMPLDWIPLRPERVVEVSYDRVDDGRFRHPARVVRWRPDRDPRSATFDQL